MKEVLIIHYSQSGQLTDIVHNLGNALQEQDINVNYCDISMQKPYPFPWSKATFFDAFPESFLQVPENINLNNPELLSKKYDLVILGYSVWFLSPSIPTTSFLKSAFAKALLANTPVVTLIGCRNMWVQAQEKVKKHLRELEAKHVGHIALVDRHINHISVITITHWMFSGKKTKYLGIFPKPGVSDNDIKGVTRFAPEIRSSLQSGTYDTLQSNLLSKGAVVIKPFLVLADKRANVLFSKWAKFIYKKGPSGDPRRKKWLVLFNYYLMFAIWVIAPIVFIVFLITYLPLYNRIQHDKKYYSSVG